MCGRYVSPDDAALERLYALDRRHTNPFARRYNVAPTTMVPILLREADGDVILREARWGLIPPWWKEARPPGNTFNARSEEAPTRSMWRAALDRGRCLVPAEGWYEWKAQDVVDRLTGEVRPGKQPYFLHHPTDPVLTFAGLFASWTGADGVPIVSCAILTRAASPGLESVHHRMPVVLGPDDRDAWLDPAARGDRARQVLERAQSSFEFHPVSPRVNNARNDTPDLVQPESTPERGAVR